MSREAAALEHLRELWADEGCSWAATHTGYGKDPGYWSVELEWSTDGLLLHNTDWVTLHWRFYGDTLIEALEGAAEWCGQLAPWRPCPECDGRGEWQGTPCADCNETGLSGSYVPGDKTDG